jgi:hypothetical protein
VVLFISIGVDFPGMRAETEMCIDIEFTVLILANDFSRYLFVFHFALKFVV